MKNEYPHPVNTEAKNNLSKSIRFQNAIRALLIPLAVYGTLEPAHAQDATPTLKPEYQTDLSTLHSRSYEVKYGTINSQETSLLFDYDTHAYQFSVENGTRTFLITADLLAASVAEYLQHYSIPESISLVLTQSFDDVTFKMVEVEELYSAGTMSAAVLKATGSLFFDSPDTNAYLRDQGIEQVFDVQFVLRLSDTGDEAWLEVVVNDEPSYSQLIMSGVAPEVELPATPTPDTQEDLAEVGYFGFSEEAWESFSDEEQQQIVEYQQNNTNIELGTIISTDGHVAIEYAKDLYGDLFYKSPDLLRTQTTTTLGKDGRSLSFWFHTRKLATITIDQESEDVFAVTERPKLLANHKGLYGIQGVQIVDKDEPKLAISESDVVLFSSRFGYFGNPAPAVLTQPTYENVQLMAEEKVFFDEQVCVVSLVDNKLTVKIPIVNNWFKPNFKFQTDAEFIIPIDELARKEDFRSIYNTTAYPKKLEVLLSEQNDEAFSAAQIDDIRLKNFLDNPRPIEGSVSIAYMTAAIGITVSTDSGKRDISMKLVFSLDPRGDLLIHELEKYEE